MLTRLSSALAAAAVLVAAAPAGAAGYPPGFNEAVLVSGLTRPSDVAFAPDGRMFVIQKDGLLLVVAPGSTTATPIRDFSPVVNGQRDRGLLGLAVDADFAANRYVYLLYTYDLERGAVPESQGPMVSQLLRTRVSPVNTSTFLDDTIILGTYTQGVCPAPENTLDCIPSEGTTHSIGTVRAAPDGTLWVGSGDGLTPGTSFPDRTHAEESMAGKILHIDRDGKGLPGHPFCPADANLDHVCTKVWASGFRNPFRFTLRPGGGLVVGDVGWAAREEIDLVGAGGRSYGWPCYEGSIRTPGYQGRPECAARYAEEGTAAAATGPVYDYAHSGSNAVVAGPTYTGGSYPAGYRDSIFFGDFTGRFIRRLVPQAGGGFTVESFAEAWRGVALETAPGGDLVSVNPGSFQPNEGSVTRVLYTPTTPPPAPSPSPSPSPPADAVPMTARPASSPRPDTTGPRMRVSSVLPRRGRLSGTATDPGGVRSVTVALRRKLAGRGCRWWLPARAELSGVRRCTRPVLIRASLRRAAGTIRWSVDLGGPLTAGGYRLLVRGVDRAGNAMRLADGRGRLVRVGR